MSELRISVPDEILKSFIDDIPEALRVELPAWILSLDPSTAPLDEPVILPVRRRPPRPRKPRTRSPQITPYQAKRAAMEDLEIRRLRRDGFTPYFGKKKRFLMTPPEFTLVLAFEPREVAQVIHEVLLQLVGYPGDSADGRREWVVLSQRHFERRGIMSQAKAQRTLTYAVERGYLLRRRRGPQQWEYGVHYRQVDNGTGEPVENFSN